MDLRSIVRAFRFGEMQRRSEVDPGAKRPPTILFAAVFVGLLAATVAVGAGIYYLQGGSSGGGEPMGTDAPDASDVAATNTTSPSSAPADRSVGGESRASMGPIRRF